MQIFNCCIKFTSTEIHGSIQISFYEGVTNRSTLLLNLAYESLNLFTFGSLWKTWYSCCWAFAHWEGHWCLWGVLRVYGGIKGAFSFLFYAWQILGFMGLWQNSSQLLSGSLLNSIIYNGFGAEFNDKHTWWSVRVFGPRILRVVGLCYNILNVLVLTACNWHMHFKQMKLLKWK